MKNGYFLSSIVAIHFLPTRWSPVKGKTVPFAYYFTSFFLLFKIKSCSSSPLFLKQHQTWRCKAGWNRRAGSSTFFATASGCDRIPRHIKVISVSCYLCTYYYIESKSIWFSIDNFKYIIVNVHYLGLFCLNVPYQWYWIKT